MAMDVEIIVFSESPKNLGTEVKVVVGLPSKNPWSLPFGHKRIFAENVDRYDLFAYSEDDMEVTEANIRSFLRMTGELQPDEIAGFLRYEQNENGDCSLPDVHGPFHWRPESVRQRGEYTIAEFTNEHAAFYLLTQEQLKRAIASGGFLRGPYEGRYDMLCTAATDPYTCCGFRKVIGISHLKHFLIRHLSNRYAGKIGLSLAAFHEQVQILSDIRQRKYPVTTLCDVEARGLGVRWAKSYYEKPRERLLATVPHEAKEVLSIGCGSGETEAELVRRGANVTALPLDSVIGVAAARRGTRIVYGSLQECLKSLVGQKFQCVFVTDLLHLLPNPRSVVEDCAELVEDGGALVAAGPNFDRLPVLVKRSLGVGEYQKLRDFKLGGINAISAARLTRWMRQAGLRPEAPVWSNQNGHWCASGALGSWQRFRNKVTRILFQTTCGRFTADDWVVRGRK
jgi:2-polyprenyl-3-methyl-5-hydroxy-6-metoxy-1,4-benzoquinol methylase